MSATYSVATYYFAWLNPIEQYLNEMANLLYNDLLFFFFLNGPNPAYFCLFSLFIQDKYSTNLTLNDKALIMCLGLEPGRGRMVGAD